MTYTKQKRRRNSDILNLNTPTHSYKARGEIQWYPPLPKRGQGVLSDIYPCKSDIIVYCIMLVSPLF